MPSVSVAFPQVRALFRACVDTAVAVAYALHMTNTEKQKRIAERTALIERSKRLNEAARLARITDKNGVIQ